MKINHIYEKIRQHLLEQKSKSRKVESGKQFFAYRGDEGKMCAIGCLITDDAYGAYLETYGIEKEEVRQSLRKSGVVFDDKVSMLLSDLQSIHDSTPVNHWEYHLDIIKERYNIGKA